MYQLFMEQTMSPNSENNPLTKYFRQPAIYIKLPSNGRWWPEEALNMPITGELPVYPMTSKDEIVLKTPDALMNGAGMADVVQSCCPNIVDPWQMPSIDMDAVLIAIRIASYGHNMEFDSTCPHCKHENSHVKDLRDSLSSVQCPDYDTPVTLDNLLIKLKPAIYRESNRSKQINFEEQKMLQAIESSTLEPEAKSKEITGCMSRLIRIGLEVLTAATESVTINNDVVVTNPEHILEFYANSETTAVKKVQDRLGELNTHAGLEPIPVLCNECSGAYKIPIEFDYANFFANGF